jgi:hypothetical protein
VGLLLDDLGREARPPDAEKPRRHAPAIDEKYLAAPNVIGVIVGR